MRPASRLGAIACALALWTSADISRAEVSVLVDDQGQYRGTLLMYRVGSPPSDVWKKIRPVDDRFVLNSQGDAWGDGLPDFACDPATGRPQVVWPQGAGGATEIVLAHWDGERWTSPVAMEDGLAASGLPFARDTALRLSASQGPWFSPRLGIGANSITHVVWGESDATPSVWYRDLRLASGELGDLLAISDPALPSRDPDILIGFDRIFIGVEQEESGLRLVVVIQADETDFVAQRDSEPFRRRVITISLCVGRIGLDLFIEAGTARARWQEEQALFGMSDYLQDIDNWSNPYYMTGESQGAFGP